MHVGLLSSLLVRVDGHDMTLNGQRVRDVLTVLLQRRGRPVPPEVVLDLGWGERAAGLTGAAVHTLIARLRRLLGPCWAPAAIETHDVGYLVDRGTTTDEDSFAAIVQRGCRLFDLGDSVAACAAHRDALAHWRGEVSFAGVSDELVGADRAPAWRSARRGDRGSGRRTAGPSRSKAIQGKPGTWRPS